MRGQILSYGQTYRSELPVGMPVNGVVAVNALAMVGRDCHYHLAYPNGGADPRAPYPWDPQTKGCDCIGFAAWCCGFDRFQPKKFPLYDGYINTDSMIEEAMRFGKWFTLNKAPEIGGFIVGESYKKGTKRIIGHIGVVTDMDEWDTKGLAGIHVVHCSSSNAARPGNKYGSAIWKTTGEVWKLYPKQRFITFNRDYAMGVVPK